MLDRERLLAKIDALDGYLREVHEILPLSIDEYKGIEKRRACERLLQVSIECVIDICGLLVAGLRLGLPAEEEDLFEKLDRAGIISPHTREALRRMRGFRNILVHDYGHVEDLIVFEILRTRLGDFNDFKQEILKYIRK
jgi:uncharacterized protein YutE (UPF0331/DUF86 family)